MIGLIVNHKIDAFNYILKVIKSCETSYHFKSCEGWIENLHNVNVIKSSQYNVLIQYNYSEWIHKCYYKLEAKNE